MPATYEPIATTTLTSSSSSMVFSSVPSTFTDLRLVILARTDRAGSLQDNMRIRFNANNSGSYSSTLLFGDGGSAISYRNTNATGTTDAYPPAASAPAGVFGFTTFDIFSYTQAVNKTVLMTDSQDYNGSGNLMRGVGLWRSTSAITRIDIYSVNSANFVAGTTATLYGILRA